MRRVVWLVTFAIGTLFFGLFLGPLYYPMGGRVTIAHLLVGAGAGLGIASWVVRQIDGPAPRRSSTEPKRCTECGELPPAHTKWCSASRHTGA
jgi:hypothetical protein